MRKIYAFEKLHTFLDNKKYPKVTSEGFEVIKTDFSKAFKEGKISFEGDGIYLEYKGKKWRGYMFMGEQIGENEFRGNYRVKFYNDYPKFHLKKCDVIEDFIKNNKFNQFYIWSNDKHIDVLDRDTKEIHKEQQLRLCAKCRSMLINPENTTYEFYETLKKEGIFIEEKVEVDIFGYTRNWNVLSKEIRKKRNYTCEQCNIQVDKKDRKYIHIHHKDGDKLNNSESNLQCLCISCHSEHHPHKISKKDLEKFSEKYKSK